MLQYTWRSRSQTPGATAGGPHSRNNCTCSCNCPGKRSMRTLWEFNKHETTFENTGERTDNKLNLNTRWSYTVPERVIRKGGSDRTTLKRCLSPSNKKWIRKGGSDQQITSVKLKPLKSDVSSGSPCRMPLRGMVNFEATYGFDPISILC